MPVVIIIKNLCYVNHFMILSQMINVDMINELCSWAVEQFDDLKQYDLVQLMPACVLALCGWHMW